MIYREKIIKKVDSYIHSNNYSTLRNDLLSQEVDIPGIMQKIKSQWQKITDEGDESDLSLLHTVKVAVFVTYRERINELKKTKKLRAQEVTALKQIQGYLHEHCQKKYLKLDQEANLQKNSTRIKKADQELIAAEEELSDLNLYPTIQRDKRRIAENRQLTKTLVQRQEKMSERQQNRATLSVYRNKLLKIEIALCALAAGAFWASFGMPAITRMLPFPVVAVFGLSIGDVVYAIKNAIDRKQNDEDSVVITQNQLKLSPGYQLVSFLKDKISELKEEKDKALEERREIQKNIAMLNEEMSTLLDKAKKVKPDESKQKRFFRPKACDSGTQCQSALAL